MSQIYAVRVTRVFEEEYVDYEVRASSKDAAKEKALSLARARPNDFGLLPDPEFIVASMDEPEVIK